MKDIIKNFKQFRFDYVQDYKTYDYLLVISGCPVKCADTNKYKIKNKIIDINNENYKDYKKIIYDAILS